jgi:hypothetical protein
MIRRRARQSQHLDQQGLTPIDEAFERLALSQTQVSGQQERASN